MYYNKSVIVRTLVIYYSIEIVREYEYIIYII